MAQTNLLDEKQNAKPQPARPQPETNKNAGGIEREDGGKPFVRKPFGGDRYKLAYAQRPGYYRYWFLDDPEMIEKGRRSKVTEAQEAGYSHVMENGQPVTCIAGRGGMQLFLMEIPQEWFDEDMKRNERDADEIDAALRGGQIGRKPGDNRYVPKDGIKFQDD